jgi:cytochrome c oxidase subunit 6a
MDLWRKVSYYVCIPAGAWFAYPLSPPQLNVFVLVLVGGIWTYKVEKEHAEHIHHEREANGGELPETPAYDHMNRRVKPFPWGASACRAVLLHSNSTHRPELSLL